MPLYEYKCHSCGEVFEVLQKFSDEPLTVHEKCGGSLERLISPPAFQFKGSGWYVTDYAKGGSSKPGKNGKEAGKESTKSETKSEAKSETKSDTKSDTKKESTVKGG
jgi:putative FmdB family regulatory protein